MIEIGDRSTHGIGMKNLPVVKSLDLDSFIIANHPWPLTKDLIRNFVEHMSDGINSHLTWIHIFIRTFPLLFPLHSPSFVVDRLFFKNKISLCWVLSFTRSPVVATFVLQYVKHFYHLLSVLEKWLYFPGLILR